MSKAPSSTDNLFAGAIAKAAENKAEPDVETVVEPVIEAPEAPAEAMPSELDMLKNRARLMGIQFSNNIGVDALKARIQAKLDGEAEKDEETQETQETKEPSTQNANPEVASKPVSKPKTLRQLIWEREMKLVRLRIQNLDPKKKDLPGEILTVANEYLGTVRKFIPYGEATENGYHVPHCLYQQLKERQFLQIKVRKNSKGQEIVETADVREFALEVLPQLTTRELAELKAAQQAAGGLD